MEEILINELLAQLVESQSGVDCFLDKRLDTGHLSVLASRQKLQQALACLMKPGTEAKWVGSFVSVSSQVRHLPRKPIRNQSGPFVMVSICHVQMKQTLMRPRQLREKPNFAKLKQAMEIVEAQGGRLEVESFRQTGCTFSVYLPLVKTEGPARPAAADQEERILVVDDDPLQRSVMGRVLARQGYSVETCPSGEDALELLKEGPRDLIVLDMMLDGITGTETYSRLLEFQPSQKAIIVSGSCLTELIDKALQLGAGTFLSKPITPKDLTLAVRNELDRNPEKTEN